MSDKQPIAAIRKKAGMTLDAAAEKFGVDRTTVIRWEKGKPCIPLKRLGEAAEIFNTTKQAIRPDIFAE